MSPDTETRVKGLLRTDQIVDKCEWNLSYWNQRFIRPLGGIETSMVATRITQTEELKTYRRGRGCDAKDLRKE
ncbi:unnamed protein product [Lathyrus oleraceus]